MTGRTKIILVLLIGGGTGYLLHRASELTWGARLSAVITRTYQSTPIQTGDLPTFRAELTLPHGSAAGNNIEVPEGVFQKLAASDGYERRSRTLPFLGLQAFDHRATRHGQVVAEWDEGHALLIAGAAGSGLVAGVVGAAVLATLLGALGLRKAPNV